VWVFSLLLFLAMPMERIGIRKGKSIKEHMNATRKISRLTQVSSLNLFMIHAWIHVVRYIVIRRYMRASPAPCPLPPPHPFPLET
jgi:hypothetical protein